MCMADAWRECGAGSINPAATSSPPFSSATMTCRGDCHRGLQKATRDGSIGKSFAGSMSPLYPPSKPARDIVNAFVWSNNTASTSAMLRPGGKKSGGCPAPSSQWCTGSMTAVSTGGSGTSPSGRNSEMAHRDAGIGVVTASIACGGCTAGAGVRGGSETLCAECTETDGAVPIGVIAVLQVTLG